MMVKQNLIELIEKETGVKLKYPMFDEEGNPQCCVCGKGFVQINKYNWRGGCEHVSKDYILSHVRGKK